MAAWTSLSVALAMTVIAASRATFAGEDPARESPHRGPVTDLILHGERMLSCSQAGVLSTNLDGRDARWLIQPSFRVLSLAAASGEAHAVVFGGGRPAESGVIAVVDGRTGRLIAQRVVGEDLVYSIAVDASSNTVAAALASGSVITLPLDNLSGAPIVTRHRHTATARDVDFSPDGSRLASCGHDGVVLISSWLREEAGDGKVPVALAGHTAAVHCLAFSPDGSRIASAARNGKVRIHRIDGQQVRSYAGLDGEVSSLVWGGNGQFAGTALGDLYRLSADDDSSTLLAKSPEPLFALLMRSGAKHITTAGFSVRRLDLGEAVDR